MGYRKSWYLHILKTPFHHYQSDTTFHTTIHFAWRVSARLIFPTLTIFLWLSLKILIIFKSGPMRLGGFYRVRQIFFSRWCTESVFRKWSSTHTLITSRVNRCSSDSLQSLTVYRMLHLLQSSVIFAITIFLTCSLRISLSLPGNSLHQNLYSLSSELTFILLKHE